MADTSNSLIHFNLSNDVTVGTIEALASLDSEGARRFGDEVVAHINENPGIKLLINFQNITYLSSSVLSELLRMQEAAQTGKGSVRLCGVSGTIHKVFEVTNLAQVFKVNPDEDVEKTIIRLNKDSEWDVYPG